MGVDLGKIIKAISLSLLLCFLNQLLQSYITVQNAIQLPLYAFVL